MNKRFNYKTINIILAYIFLLAAVFITLLPLISMVGTSFKTKAEVLSTSSIIPEHFSIYFYQYVLSASHFLTYLKNSFLIAIAVAVTSTFLAILGGYSLSRYRKKIKALNIYVVFLLAMQMFPVILLIIPLYITFQSMHTLPLHCR
jgi:ABC-type glycerol-3-phosphate transport system permease component